MCKALDEGMVIEEIKLLEKRGGKSDWASDLRGVKVSVHAEREELKKLVEEHLKKLGAEFAEKADIYVSVGENLPMGRELRAFGSVVALYDFARDPKAVGR